MTKKEEKKSIFSTISNKIAVSIISSTGWLAFVLYWVAFQWGNYNFFQNIVIIIISGLVVGAINGVVWTRWSK